MEPAAHPHPVVITMDARDLRVETARPGVIVWLAAHRPDAAELAAVVRGRRPGATGT